ncbi:HlyD family efflux transporter periplasmic adaptor subunit [Paraburkholderia phenazinium]|uniref:Putative peptide zinc metalloprotease protein n=1 Tax=Paraburkholderia phenazinium TaxID=60549 RepID=A0A1G7U6B4_9BURK|nr:HlyD family efflux transporter periplasmic adaptor subunit [Paraburkholderia phenazinium]SDG43195.1 putative peptide zinc metalloprotease protein [Paraburkholderia phenazinium]
MPRLPQLRQELTLTRGAATPDGAPTWMLHDPAGNRFFQIGWPAFEMLSRWALDDPQAIAESINTQTTLKVAVADLEALVKMLRQQNLLVSASASDTGRLAATAAASRLSHAMWLLKHYLMIRVPLWHPMAFLRRFARYAELAYRPAFWIGVALAALLGLALVSRQWDKFVHTFHGYADLRGLLAIGLALAFAKVLHEFGHAFTAYRYGCRVPTMGVALLVMLPVLYTDTTEAWKVPDRVDRLRIGAAGMLSELALAAFATLAWSLLPDGPMRAGAFLLATTTWIGTLTINASPFMRFDGYFLLSDWLDIPNLHDRAFAFGRWRMREWLFGFPDPQPEPCSPGRRRFLIAFSLVTWLYRLVVFFSIALVVYHAFFKALGVMLFCVEFGWFIVRPVVREATTCWRRRHELRWCRQTVRSSALGALLFVFAVLPWHGGVNAPAVFGPLAAQGLYAPEAGYVLAETALAHDGQRVRAGDVLAVLASPDLEHRLKTAQAEEAQLRWEVQQQSFDPRLLEQGVALTKQWDAARETVAGLEAQVAQLTLRAPFDGTVQTDEELAPGTWLARGERLFDVIGPVGVKGDAYVGEDDAGRIEPGDTAQFVASVAEMGTLHCRVSAVDRVNVATLDEPALASVYGGPVPAEQQPGTKQLVPLVAIYRVRIDQCKGDKTLARQIDGTATLGGARESFAVRGFKRLVSVLEREGGA